MKLIKDHAEKFLSILSRSPEVQAVMKQQNQLEDEEARKARRNCLEQIRHIEPQLKPLQQALDLELANLKNARDVVQQRLQAVSMASQNFKKVESVLNRHKSDLVTKHGEWFVNHALDSLRKHKETFTKQLILLEMSINPRKMIVNGFFSGFEPVDNQKIIGLIGKLEKNVKAIDLVYPDIEILIESDLSPSEIELRCKNALNVAGCLPQNWIDEPTAIPAGMQ